MKRVESKLQLRQDGQAMVEFALMLLVIMALLVGMVHVANLLNYDYWAQQEARYLAFEQTWVPASYYEATGETPQTLLTNGQYLHRPKSVSRLDADKDVSDEGSLSVLLSSLFSPTDAHRGTEAGAGTKYAASSESIWHRSTSEWLAGIKRRTELVKAAYAGLSGDSGIKREVNEVEPSLYQPRLTQAILSEYSPDSLERGVYQVLETVDFGEKFCAGMRDVFSKHNWQPGVQAFSERSCGETYNTDFAIHLAQNVDMKGMFRDYAYQLEGGVDHVQAIDAVLQVEITNQFYSFFDDAVALARIGAVPYIVGVRAEKSLGGSLQDVIRIITQARYVGSSIAVGLISGGQLTQVLGVDPTSRNVAAEKNLQDTIFSVLHADVPDVSYALSPLYLPVPPMFFGGMSALQNAAMENVLRGGEDAIGDFFGDPAGDDSDLIDPLIYNSNKESVVRYDSGKGIFPAAARRFKNDTTLTSRFFLVTQPWHIPRRESPTGAYRQIGTQTDGIGEQSEEAMLRRRVAGLWLFPSAPGAFFKAPFEYLDVDGLDAVFDVVSGVDSFIATIKTQLIDNPITKLFDALSDIPLIGGLVPVIPKFPAVRPAAYPDSIELRDQAHSEDDQLTGEVRNFSDYIDEQLDYNPEPKPEFDNDTFD